MNHWVIRLLISTLLSGGVAHAETAVSVALENWYSLNQKCRGGADDSALTVAACEERNGESSVLKALGCAYQPGDKWICPGRTPTCLYSTREDKTICK